MQVGTQVITKHGTGQIVGKDLPESQHVWRWIVQITSPTDAAAEMVSRFRDAHLCYFPHEISETQ